MAGGRLTFGPVSFICLGLIDFEETLRSNRSSYCLRVCRLSCTSRRPGTLPVSLKKGTWPLVISMFFSFIFFGANYKEGPDNPHGTANTAGTQAFLAFLLQECSLSLFFRTCFSGGWGGGCLVTSSCITSW